jgi:rare lipoprotein A
VGLESMGGFGARPARAGAAAVSRGPGTGAWAGPSRLGFWVSLVGVAMLVGCASSGSGGSGAVSGGGSRPERDGPEASPPPNLEWVQDAVPRIEPIRVGGPNKPYEVLGRSYTPITQDAPLLERGLASWYGRKFHGRRTANGEVYDMYAMTAAHPTMPLPSYARVRNPKNGREVVVRVNDRGPFHPGRVIDLSYTAALKLDLLRGVAPVEVERITFDAIRTGSWRRSDQSAVAEMPRSAPRSTQAATASSGPSTTPATASAIPAGLSAGAQAGAAGGAAGAGASVESAGAAAGVAASTGVLVTPGSSTAAVATPPKSPSADPLPRALAPVSEQPAKGYWVQLGAFRQREGAESFHRQVIADVEWLAPLLAVFDENALFRLQAGPFESRAQAQSAAQRVREALRLVPQVLERR